MRQPTKGHEVVAELQKAAEHHRKLRDHAHQQARDHFGKFVTNNPPPPPQQQGNGS